MTLRTVIVGSKVITRKSVVEKAVSAEVPRHFTTALLSRGKNSECHNELP